MSISERFVRLPGDPQTWIAGVPPVFAHNKRRLAMLLVREIMYCKPGKVRSMVEKFVAMSALMERAGQGRMRVMTDLVGERYWTIVSEFEVESLDAFEKMMSGQGAPMDAEAQEQMESLMKGYHDLVEYGRREVYRIEN
jgi:hypothetical protein